MKTFKSFRAKYKPPYHKDKLGLLRQEIDNLSTRNRNEADSDIGDRIEQLRKQYDELSRKGTHLPHK